MGAPAAGGRVPRLDLPLLGGGLARLHEEGRPHLVFAAKHDCPTCRLAAPLVERMYRRADGATARIVALLQDGAEEAEAFARSLGLTMTILLDEAPYAAGAALGLEAVPTLLLLDSDGLVARSEIGFSREGYGEIAGRLARLAGSREQPLFGPGDDVPAFRPG